MGADASRQDRENENAGQASGEIVRVSLERREFPELAAKQRAKRDEERRNERKKRCDYER